MLKTLVLDTFAGEHAIKPLDFDQVCAFCIFAQGFASKVQLFKQQLDSYSMLVKLSANMLNTVVLDAFAV